MRILDSNRNLCELIIYLHRYLENIVDGFASGSSGENEREIKRLDQGLENTFACLEVRVLVFLLMFDLLLMVALTPALQRGYSVRYYLNVVHLR